MMRRIDATRASIAACGSAGVLHRLLRRELAVGVRQRDRGLGRADIDADDDALVVQAEECGPAAARQPSRGAFEHPALLHQLLDDERDGAALQSRRCGPGRRARSDAACGSGSGRCAG